MLASRCPNLSPPTNGSLFSPEILLLPPFTKHHFYQKTSIPSIGLSTCQLANQTALGLFCTVRIVIYPSLSRFGASPPHPTLISPERVSPPPTEAGNWQGRQINPILHLGLSTKIPLDHFSNPQPSLDALRSCFCKSHKAAPFHQGHFRPSPSTASDSVTYVARPELAAADHLHHYNPSITSLHAFNTSTSMLALLLIPFTAAVSTDIHSFSFS